jgi:hypothetical protein
MSHEHVSLPRSAPEQLLHEVHALHAALHAGHPTPMLPAPQNGQQDAVFLLDHVAEVSQHLLARLKITEPKQSGPTPSTMQRIRANVNALSQELVGCIIASELQQVTLQELISNVQSLNSSVGVPPPAATCALI